MRVFTKKRIPQILVQNVLGHLWLELTRSPAYPRALSRWAPGRDLVTALERKKSLERDSSPNQFLDEPDLVKAPLATEYVRRCDGIVNDD